MSSFNVSLDGATEIAVQVSGTSPVVIVDGTDGAGTSTGAWSVPWVSVGETAGATPNVTVDLYDADGVAHPLSADGYCWTAKAIAAKQAISFDDVIVPTGWKLRVTSSAGGLSVTGIASKRTKSK